MSTVTVTRALRETQDVISAFIARNGYSPSLREIADCLGLCAVSTIHVRLQKMRRLGLIAFEPGSSRTLRIIQCPRRDVG